MQYKNAVIQNTINDCVITNRDHISKCDESNDFKAVLLRLKKL